jgi:hypothetical protein
MSDLLRIEYIPLSRVRRWYKNPKKHDLGAIAESIERYGFVDPPKFDPAINDGAGGLVYGNGRDEALEWMRAQGRKLPRGIAYDEQLDEWCMPVVFGVDAASQAAAESLAVAHNNLTMAGGDFGPEDQARMWDSTYTSLLQELHSQGELPAGMDADDLDSLIKAANEPEPEPSDGSLLELTNVTLAPPRFEVETGDVWTVGGEGGATSHGHTMSPEHRERLRRINSELRRGKPLPWLNNPDVKERSKPALRAAHERRRAEGRSSWGKRSDESKARMSAAKKGRTFSEEHRQKLSAAKKGKKQTPEFIERRVAPLRGRKRNREESPNDDNVQNK